MSVTKQDIKDSFNPFKPSKYIKARIKLLPYTLIVALILGLMFMIQSFFN